MESNDVTSVYYMETSSDKVQISGSDLSFHWMSAAPAAGMFCKSGNKIYYLKERILVVINKENVLVSNNSISQYNIYWTLLWHLRKVDILYGIQEVVESLERKSLGKVLSATFSKFSRDSSQNRLSLSLIKRDWNSA